MPSLPSRADCPRGTEPHVYALTPNLHPGCISWPTDTRQLGPERPISSDHTHKGLVSQEQVSPLSQRPFQKAERV